MLTFQIAICLSMFVIGTLGILYNRRDILIVLVCIELLLLSVGILFIVFSIYLDDMIGQLFAIFILTVAAAESSIGLGILTQYYKITGDISVIDIGMLRVRLSRVLKARRKSLELATQLMANERNSRKALYNVVIKLALQK
ncbi:hypothetical protein Lal_00015404 [Lupinus albus]|nr:hypothetical protein Lal_00015404 [Lupinus albus]